VAAKVKLFVPCILLRPCRGRMGGRAGVAALAVALLASAVSTGSADCIDFPGWLDR
jgi:hypothetical protein